MIGLTSIANRPDWELLTTCEPALAGLGELVNLAVAGIPDGPWCANEFMRVTKPLLTPFVGWYRGVPVGPARNLDDKELPMFSFKEFLERKKADPSYQLPATHEYERMLRTSEAYDAARQHIYDKLPACRQCGCI